MRAESHPDPPGGPARATGTRRYLGVLFALTGVLVVLYVLFNAHVQFRETIFGYQELYAYQLEKVKRLPHDVPITLFLGDSSLGNAIDADLFGRLSGTPSFSLALTGLYGYAGPYNMLKKAAEHRRVRNVVVMNTLDMAEREVAYDGYLYSIGSMDDVRELTWGQRAHVGAALASALFTQSNMTRVSRIALERYVLGKPPRPGSIVADYIRQAHPTTVPERVPSPVSVERINPEKRVFLERIVAYCRARGVNLVYVHGPLLARDAWNVEPYVRAANRMLAETGITVVPHLVRIPPDKLGDRDDHVRPEFKPEFTREYYRLLRDYLVP
jgi:hypothetical protein